MISRKGAVAPKWVKMSSFFIGENLSLGSGWSHVKRLSASKRRNPPKIGGFAYIIGIHRFTMSKLGGRFSQLIVFQKKVY